MLVIQHGIANLENGRFPASVLAPQYVHYRIQFPLKVSFSEEIFDFYSLYRNHMILTCIDWYSF